MSMKTMTCHRCGSVYEFYGEIVPECQKCGYPKLDEKGSNRFYVQMLGQERVDELERLRDASNND